MKTNKQNEDNDNKSEVSFHDSQSQYQQQIQLRTVASWQNKKAFQTNAFHPSRYETVLHCCQTKQRSR